ncbi:MAG: type IV pili methyl-accepting chemotaxis transducer N-terminal domain-containing protein [Xanthomonadales bacterium]|nr:type IV pili methyl-accepting chemotaxis transducer N-terminal domain-containing protein [Xanthomonadales bacterium]
MSVTSNDLGRHTRTLPAWQVVILLLLIVGFIVNSIMLDNINSNRIEHTRATDDIQIKAQQLAQHAVLAASGDQASFDDLKIKRDSIATKINSLNDGDKDNRYPRVPVAANDSLNTLNNSWFTIQSNVDKILDKQVLIQDMNAIYNKFASEIPLLQSKNNEVVNQLVVIKGDRELIKLAGEQQVLADRMLRRMGEVLKGGMAAVQASEDLASDTRRFSRVLNGMFNGDDTIKAVTDDTVLESLGQVYNIFSSLQGDIEEVMNAQELYEAQVATEDIGNDIPNFINKANDLSEVLKGIIPKFPSVEVQYALGGLSLLWLIVILFSMTKNDRKRAKVAQELNERNQLAILRLLDEMGSLADGDLTVNATVSEDITGAIADSVNFAVEALRSLVKTINDASVGVASAAQEAQATALHLAEASEHQAQQITNASTAINEIAVSIDEVSINSLESADVAQRSVLIAHNGAEIVRQTIEGMDNIRNQIQETSKRIKRLGESSQEIGNIVELINDISEQTNILALNAAIQAASAGEAGRGFAVVADEVQSLAERASNATKQIETLVQTIQSDTNEAVASMEQTTAEVVDGAKRAENAGDALTEIEAVSNDLAELIQNISESAKQQSVAATNISGTMNVIQEITTQTSVGTQQTAESIGNLVELANELRLSVQDFKLPTEEF